MISAPAYLQEVIQFVEQNLDSPVRVALALASLLTDDQSVTSKSGVGSEVKEFVGRWLLTEPEAATLLADPTFPVQRSLIDGNWAANWKGARRSKGPSSFKYNVCISFAGKDRNVAEGIANALITDHDLKRTVFYDEFEKTDLWGADLFNRLHRIYSLESMYCVILFSHAYLQRAWTRHELRAAQTRVLEDRRDYVLPVAIDAGAIPPEFASVGYWPYQPSDENGPLPAALEQKINAFIGTNYMSTDEIAEALKRSWIRTAFLDAFERALQSGRFNGVALFIVALAMAWDLEDAASADIHALLRLVLFSPGPVSDLFNEESLELEEGYSIRRAARSRQLFFVSKSWEERVKGYFPADWDFSMADSEDDASPIE